MTPNNRCLPLIAAAVLLLTDPAAHAAVAAAASFDEKVDNAAAIILGKCVRSESRFDPSHRWIVTYSTFTVEKSMKGGTASVITLVMPGGSVGSVHQSTVGVPEFRQGDEHVLFVKNTRLGPTVLYFDQGTYDVRTDDRGERVIAPVPMNMVTIDTQRGMAVAAADEPRTLQEFERAVQESLRTASTRKERMSAVPESKRKPVSMVGALARNKLLVALALLGVALAWWQLRRR